MTTIIIASVIVLFLWMFTRSIERVLDERICAFCDGWDRERSMVKSDPSPDNPGGERFWNTDCFLFCKAKDAPPPTK